LAGTGDRTAPLVRRLGSFEHRLRQLLEEKRHSIGALDDLVNEISWKRGRVSGKFPHQGGAFAPAEPWQRHHRYLRLAAPRWMELGPKRRNEQNRQLLDAREREIEQLARGRVDPVQIFENHEHRLLSGENFEPANEKIERLFFFSLRRQFRVWHGPCARQ
jgi:hypothetical protein